MTEHWSAKIDKTKPSNRRVKVSKSELWKAMRKMCLHCCGDMRSEVDECQAEDCPIFKYRFGKAVSPDTEKA